jgi:hypothetical protein
MHKAFMADTVFSPDMLRLPPAARAGPQRYVGILSVVVVAATLPHRLKARCGLSLGRQSVTTKVGPWTCAP